MDDIFKVLLARLRSGEQGVVAATVMHQQGSAPRGAGSRMLVFPDGGIAGSVGGGLAEATVMAKAAEVRASGHARVLDFDLSNQLAANAGMICGGRVRVLLERIDPNAQTIGLYSALVEGLDAGQGALLLVPLAAGAQGGRRLLRFLSDGQRQVLGGDVPQELLDRLTRRGSARTPEIADAAGGQWFLDPVTACAPLYLVGAGHVAKPTAQLAAMVDFRVTVMDDRPEFANSERFPDAAQVVVLGGFDSCFPEGLPPGAAVVVLTRGHMHDKAVAAQALRTSAGYVGMIGSRRKAASVLEALGQEGFTEADLRRIVSPVGLAIGAETPEEIAVSIVGQLIAWRAGAGGVGA